MNPTPMKALLPLSWLYGAGVSIHRRARMAGAPGASHPRIISIGNLEAGGNGKTPLAMWLLSRAAGRGTACAYVSRGYGGDAVAHHTVTCVLASDAAPASLAGLRVMTRTHPSLARAVGDEGALVCERVSPASAFFCSDKARAVQAAAGLGVDLVVLDDAFQSWGVARHADIVLLDAASPLDGGRLLPAGRLRENPDAILRADAVVFNGAATSAAIEAARGQVARWIRPGVPVAGMARSIRLEPAAGAGASRPEACIAVSGIARPDAFECSLREAGLRVAGHEVFPDHHSYRGRDIARIAAHMRREGVPALVTTEKDWVKLRCFAPEWPVWIACLDVTLVGDELPG
jgi:tetraacyldisaccharide 4'-kinase